MATSTDPPRRSLTLCSALALLVLGPAGCRQDPGIACPDTDVVCASGWACTASGDGCIQDECGNGAVDPGEDCDDGNLATGDSCAPDCRSACGNLTVDPGEQCDDGNGDAGDGCSAACRLEECGNGIVDIGEACDCGDGTAPAGAECGGSGNSNSAGYCSESCVIRCGDGIVDADEACDTAVALTTSCVDLGFDFGRPACTSACDGFHTEDCGFFNWRIVPSPTDQALNGLWAHDRDTVFMVGDEGTVLRYRGTLGELMPTPAGTDDLRDVWGSGPDDVFAVGDNATVLHYDGQSWQPIEALALADEDLTAVLGGGPEEPVFVVGEQGGLFRWDRSSWDVMTTADGFNSLGLYDLLRAGNGDVYAFGTGSTGISKGLILRYDGNAENEWHTMFHGPQNGCCLRYTFLSAWGSDAGDLYLVERERDDDGSEYYSIRRYDGVDPPASVYGSSGEFRSIWGSGPEDIFAVGTGNEVLHFHGERWARMPIPGIAALNAVGGTDARNVFAVGDEGLVLHYSGYSWESFVTDAADANFTAVWGDAWDNVYATASVPFENFDAEGRVYRYDGAGWNQVCDAGRELHALWGGASVSGGASEEIFAVGRNRSCLYANSTWMESSSPTRMYGVWAVTPADVHSVGEGGTVWRFSGDPMSPSWDSVVAGGTLTGEDLRGIWGSGLGELFAVGNAGTVLHFDDMWAPMESVPTAEDLAAVWGRTGSDAYAVGGNGTVLHYDGMSWQLMDPVPTSLDLSAVTGDAGDNVFAVGDNGTFIHHDGDSWAPINTGTFNDLAGIWASAYRQLYIVGEGGNAYRLGYPP